jgi:hypothetical protein
MTYILVLVISVATVLLVGLTLRFVQPELFYSLRFAVTKVRMNKAFIDYHENRLTGPHVFPNLLVQDFRLNTRNYDRQTVLLRVNKIRELYRVMVRRSPVGSLVTERKPQVLISELANLVDGLGRTVTPAGGPQHSTVDASSLLAFIGNGIRGAQGLPPLSNPRQVEAWLSANPINFEQVVEILIAAVFGLAYRQETHDTSFTENTVDVAAETAATSPPEAVPVSMFTRFWLLPSRLGLVRLRFCFSFS